MSYYELFQRLMNGNHSAQMVKKVLFYVKSDFVIPNASFFSGNQWCTNFKTESQISTQTIFLIFNICWWFSRFFKIIFYYVLISRKKIVCNFLSVMFDVTVVIAEDVVFNWFILFLLFLIGTINVLILVMLAKFPQTRTVGFAAPLGKFWIFPPKINHLKTFSDFT